MPTDVDDPLAIKGAAEDPLGIKSIVQKPDNTMSRFQVAPSEKPVSVIPWYRAPLEIGEDVGASLVNLLRNTGKATPQGQVFRIGPDIPTLKPEVPQVAPGQPMVQMPRTTLEAMGQGNVLKDLVEGMTTPGAALTMPLAAVSGPVGTAARTAFAMQGGGGVAETVKSILSSNVDPEIKRRQLEELPINVGMLLGPMYDIRAARPPAAEPPVPNQTFLGMPEAERTDIQTLQSVIDDLRQSLPPESPGLVTPERTPVVEPVAGERPAPVEIPAAQRRVETPPGSTQPPPTVPEVTAPEGPIGGAAASLQDIRPAVRMIDGTEIVGPKGAPHDDIIAGIKDPAKIDRRGFKNIKTGEWIDREEGPDSGKPVPGMHAAGDKSLAEMQEDPLGIKAKGGEIREKEKTPQEEGVLTAEPESENRPLTPERLTSEQEEIERQRLAAETGGETDDRTSEGRIPSSEREGETPIEGAEKQVGGEKETPAGGVLQTPQEVGPGATGTDAASMAFRHALKNAAQVIDARVRSGKMTKEVADATRKKGDELFAKGGSVAEAQRFLQEAQGIEQPKAPQPQHLSYAEAVAHDDDAEVKRFGLVDKENVSSGLEKVAQSGGRERAALSQHLLENWGHILRTSIIDFKKHPTQEGASYDPVGNAVHMDIGAKEASGLRVPDRLLHEGAHAATTWATYSRKPEVVKNVARLTEIMEQSRKRLPEGTTDKYGIGYAHTNVREFISGLYDSPALREHLNSFVVGGRTMLSRAWDAVKDILGLKRGTAAEEAFDLVARIGDDFNLKDLNDTRARYALEPLSSPPPIANAAALHELTTPEKFKQAFNKMRGITLPLHVAASERAANALASYAVADKSVAPFAKWMVTDVLQDKWRDRNFQNVMGAAIVQDNLEALRQRHVANGDMAMAQSVNDVWNMPGSPIHSATEYQKIIANPRMKDAIDRWKATIQAEAERRHTELGGELRPVGPETGAFVNLQALLDPDVTGNLEGQIYTKQGRLTNPLLKGSAFSKEAKGTASAYEFNIRTLGERMMKFNHARYKLEQYYKAAVEDGLAYWQKPDKTGRMEPLPEGMDPAKHWKTEVVRRGTGPGMTRVENFWLRKDLKWEYRNAVATDLEPPNTLLNFVSNVLTSVQVMGPTDLFAHTVNILADVATSPGGGSFLYDAVRKAASPVGVADAVVRVGWNMFKAYAEHADLDKAFVPDVQRQLSKITDIAAGRSAVIKGGGLTHPTALLLKAIDRAGRLAKDKMFDSLVRDYGVEDNDFNRREFINQLGQYETRLLTPGSKLGRETNLSPFVVAGTTMNRNAIRQVLIGAGPRSFRVTDPVGWSKMRVLDGLGAISTLFGLTIGMNLLLTKTMFGRPGTHPGMIDLGGPEDKHGKHKEFDLAQLTLYRRGLRLTGIQPMIESQAEHLGGRETASKVINTMVDAWIHPYAGPAVRFGVIAKTGKDTTGYLVSKNPESMAENVVAALKNAQPQVAAYFKGKDEGKEGMAAVGSALGQSVGVKTSRAPTLEERGVLKGNLAERRATVQTMGKTERSDLAERAAGEKAYWHSIQARDDLIAALPKAQQNFISDNGLKLAAFKPEQTVKGTRIPESKVEREFAQKMNVQETQRVLSAMMQRQDWDQLSPNAKQKVLEKGLEMAHRRVRAAIRRQMGSQTPDYDLGGMQTNPSE
jgi:hypothetical protein